MALPSRETQAAEPAASDYLSWEAPGAPSAVRIHLDVVDAISTDAIDGFNALRRRGVEVGGILLGRREAGLISIERNERVSCEYRFGPSYILSDGDQRGFEAARARLAEDPSLAIVGYYRSHTRRNLQLEQSDLEAIERWFNGPEFVFLVVKPLDVVHLVAEIFFWKDGTLPLQSSEREFLFQGRRTGATAGANPIDFTALNGGAAAEASRTVQEVPPEAPGMTPGEETPQEVAAAETAPQIFAPEPTEHRFAPPSKPLFSQPADRGFLARHWEAAAALLLVLCALGLFFWQHGGGDETDAVGKPATPVATSAGAPGSLGLDVRPGYGDWHVTWNRDHPAIRKAARGVLAIEDGNSHRDLTLNATQLHSGAVPYKHKSDDVTFRLNVFGPEKQISTESFRVLLAGKPVNPNAAATKPPSVLPPVAKHSGEPEKSPQPAARQTGEPGLTARKVEPTPEAGRVSIPDQGPANPLNRTPSAQGGGTVNIPDLPRPTVNEPSRPHHFVPAEVLSRVRPEISEGIRSRITRETVVLVKVNIDARGRVTRATPVTRGDSVVLYLGLRASEAARRWRFEPAKDNNILVPSSQVIRFVFEK